MSEYLTKVADAPAGALLTPAEMPYARVRLTQSET